MHLRASIPALRYPLKRSGAERNHGQAKFSGSQEQCSDLQSTLSKDAEPWNNPNRVDRALVNKAWWIHQAQLMLSIELFFEYA